MKFNSIFVEKVQDAIEKTQLFKIEQYGFTVIAAEYTCSILEYISAFCEYENVPLSHVK